MRQDRTNPFPGLRPFDVDENELFFGRSFQTDQLLARLRQSRFTAVVGTSGSGKSSLVRAGLLPALKRGLMAAAGSRWRIAVFRPINDPIGNLTQALKTEEVFADPKASDKKQLSFIDSTLRRSSLGLVELVRQSKMKAEENLLIVVDQFEELFRFEETFTCENPADEATAFVKLLLAATVQQREVPIYLVLTMRSDYLGESARFRGLPEAINEGQYLVPRMNDDERRQAITAPVAVGKGQISEPLVNRLLNDSGDDPSKLPLLQHALMRTWENWENDGRAYGGPLGISNYEAIGSLSGSLSKHANDVFDELSSAQKLVAERVFKALTAKGPDGRGVRTPRTFGELCAIAAVEESSASPNSDVRAVIEAYRSEGRSFLMPPPRRAESPEQIAPLLPETLIDISHESLILGWDKLQQWVEDEANSARMYKRLAECAVLYDQDVDNLLEPPALPVFLEWREKQQPNQAWASRYFNPEWTSHFREGGSKDSEYDTEFERADAFLSYSQNAFETQLDIEKKAARARLRRLAYTAIGFAVLFLVATIGAVAAYKQSQQAKAALVIANTEKVRAEEATLRALAAEKERQMQLVKTEEQKQVAIEERRLADQQRLVAQEARAQAVDAKREAEKQRDAATSAAVAASESQRQALLERDRAETAKQQALQSEAEAAKQAKLAETKQKEAEQAGEKARIALIDGNKQRARADTEFWKSDNILLTLRNIDNQTRHLKAINRQNDPITTAVFASDKKHAFVSSGNQATLFELRGDSWEFTASDFRDIPRLVYKLLGESQIAIDVETSLPSETQEKLRNFGPEIPEDSEVSDRSFTTSVVNGFNSLLKDQELPKKSGFSKVKLRQETQELLDKFKQDSTSVNLVQLNRLLLEDAYPMEIAQVNQFNESVDFSYGHYVFALSPDGARIAAKSQDREIDVFDLRGKIFATKTADYFIDSVAFSPHGKYIWSIGREDPSATANYQFLIWKNNAADDEPISLKSAVPINRPVMSPDESHIATNQLSTTAIRVWDMENNTSITLEGTDELSNDDLVKPIKANVSEGNDSEKVDLLTHLAYSNDGKYIVATFKNHRNVRVWDTTGKLIHVLSGHHCQVNSAEFSNDSTQIVSAGEDGSAFIWDRKSGRVKHELRGHMGLMITHEREGVRAWFPPIPFPLGLELQRREGQYVPLNSAKFSSDGKKVVTAGVDGRVVVWTWKKGEPFAVKTLEFKGYTGNVLNAEFSPDGKYVIAGGEDGAARIWLVPGETEKRVELKSCDDAAEIRSRNSRH